jgi:hypothetical protein
MKLTRIILVLATHFHTHITLSLTRYSGPLTRRFSRFVNAKPLLPDHGVGASAASHSKRTRSHQEWNLAGASACSAHCLLVSSMMSSAAASTSARVVCRPVLSRSVPIA